MPSPNRTPMEQGASVDKQSARVPTTIALVAIVLGVTLRVVEFMRDRPLWLDEAMLGLNIASRSLADLARPLDYDQSAPLLYLWIERIALSLGGVNERSLRALPFVAGLALIPLVWVVARHLAGAATAAIATGLVAVSVTLLSFSAEGKQYGVDPLATVIAVWLATRVVAAPTDNGRWRALILGGVVCLVISQPAAFVLAGAGLALVVDREVRGAPAFRRWIIIASTVWVAVFVALYLSLYRATAQSAYMRQFWEGTFLDPRAGDFALRLHLLDIAAFASPTLDSATLGGGGLLAVAWLTGAWTLWRRSPFAAVVVVAPLTAAAAASALGVYAVMDRLFLFAAPLTLIAYASLVSRLVDVVPASKRSGALAAACGVFLLATAQTHVERITRPVFSAVGKQVIADVDSMSRGDAVYVAARSFPLWMYYTTDWQNPDGERLKWAASISSAGAPAHNNAPSRGRVSPNEAAQLARRYRGRTEIVGLPTGRQYLTSTRTLSPSLKPAEYALPAQVDSGWAELEVQRMASAARPRLWVFGSHMFALDGAEPSLVAELQRRNVRLVMERRQGSTVAYHVEFPGEP